MTAENRIAAREDQKEVQVHHGHGKSEESEGIDETGAHHDLGPVVAPHVGTDGDDAKHEEQTRGSIIGPLPENTRAHREDQQLLQEPNARPDVRPGRRVIDGRAGRVHLLRLVILPANLDGTANLMIQAANRANVIGVVPPCQIGRADGQQLITNARALIQAACVLPDEIGWNLFLNLRPEHAPNADRSHPGNVHEHHDRVKQDPRRTRQAKRPQPSAAP